MILVVGTVRCPPDRLEALRAPMAAVLAATHAEDGCIYYAYGLDPFDAGLIRVSEVWRDRAALDAHLKAPHMDVWRAARDALGVGERNLSIYQASDPEPI
ncbi:MAG: antibiotic biosynthesis monooxygenase [Caulobacterales bacterium 32-69-10]|nr:MAG: antibiotic biosynthesis monooxygenase [Caulobacterales bacterium 32-69-10]